ncbi:MAG: hypothetical protein ACKOQ6_05885 [Bacteroidota bacterium]
MDALNRNWITESHIDFEYKKYLLLAYLQHVSANFLENRLYPYLSDLVAHYRDLKALKEEKNHLFNQFPERLSAPDMDHFRLIYEKMVQDDTIMHEIESIINFSIPQFEQYLREGRKIYEFLEDHTRIHQVGLMPLNNESGYLMLRNGDASLTYVYAFYVTVFERPGEKYRGVHLDYVNTYERSLTNTYESIKSELICFNKSLPNPATYAIECSLKIPLEETFLPIAKRSIVRRIAHAA